MAVNCLCRRLCIIKSDSKTPQHWNAAARAENKDKITLTAKMHRSFVATTQQRQVKSPRDPGVVSLHVNAGHFSTTARRVTSPTWGPPPPCKQAHNLRTAFEHHWFQLCDIKPTKFWPHGSYGYSVSKLTRKAHLAKSKLTWTIWKLNSSEESGRRSNCSKLILRKKKVSAKQPSKTTGVKIFQLPRNLK